jgi:hypothetical protein
MPREPIIRRPKKHSRSDDWHTLRVGLAIFAALLTLSLILG